MQDWLQAIDYNNLTSGIENISNDKGCPVYGIHAFRFTFAVKYRIN